jgi:hypothetical protein
MHCHPERSEGPFNYADGHVGSFRGIRIQCEIPRSARDDTRKMVEAQREFAAMI